MYLDSEYIISDVCMLRGLEVNIVLKVEVALLAGFIAPLPFSAPKSISLLQWLWGLSDAVLAGDSSRPNERHSKQCGLSTSLFASARAVENQENAHSMRRSSFYKALASTVVHAMHKWLLSVCPLKATQGIFGYTGMLQSQSFHEHLTSQAGTEALNNIHFYLFFPPADLTSENGPTFCNPPSPVRGPGQRHR